MMKIIITFLLVAATAVNLFGQFADEQDNLEKYWIYRQRLKENFIFQSDNNVLGSNLPADRIVPRVEYTNGAYERGTIRYLDWDDSNGALPYYIMMLATEYALLKKYESSLNDNATVAVETLDELENAIDVLVRLDTFSGNPANDGAFRRTDICWLWDRANHDPLNEYEPLVNHFEGLADNEPLLGFQFQEVLKDKDDPVVPNSSLSRYNSIDNVIKFIEAEAIVGEVLKTDYASTNARNKLNGLVKKMIENAYHPNEARAFWNRDILATTSFMERTWYLIDPDLASETPPGLLLEDNGGAADFITYGTSFGLAKAAESFNLNYEGTNGSWLNFRLMASLNPTYGLAKSVSTTEIYSNTMKHTWTLYDNYNHPWLFLSTPPWPVGETLIFSETNTETFNSDWMFRSLSAVCDIGSLFKTSYKYLTHSMYNRPKPLEHYPLIWNILYGKSQIANEDRDFIGNLLDCAPMCGPHNIEYIDGSLYSYEEWEWSSPNRFVWYGLCGSQDTPRHGFFNGIDYMVLHNLYWLTRVTSSESATLYRDTKTLNTLQDNSTEPISIFTRYWVKMQPGFKVSGYQKQNFSVGTTPNMRTGYDSNLKYEKQNVDFCTECDPIFKDGDPPVAANGSFSEFAKSAG
ncbi:MAG: hypothetical protein PF541_01585 [Prolixibacteraceae bacterium]|jgi:hypothetical protein|nr:hypothetical protein [Prolixibacteraceae bacterium]